MEVKVFFIKNCYRFCIDNHEVEFEEIIDIVKNSDTLNNKPECTHENPIYTFELTDSSSTGNDGIPLDLKLTLIKHKEEYISVKNKAIGVTVAVSEQHEYTFKINDTEDASCNNILQILISIIEDIIGAIQIEEMYKQSQSPNQNSGLVLK